MTAAATDTDTEPTTTDSDNDRLDHLICWCDENKALCGKDVSDLEFAEEDEEITDMCVVCIELGKPPCPRCGN